MTKNNTTKTKHETWLHKHFKLDKQYFEAYNAYASGKLKYTWFKKLMFAILGGVFIGIGYTATLLVTSYGNGHDEFKFLGALLFPVGILLCIYLGGSLFTSNCMGFISLVYKEHKVRHYVTDLFVTLVGNGIGCLLLALITWGGGLFGGVSGVPLSDSAQSIISTAIDKIEGSHQWWNNLLSGILCNIIIVGTTIVSINTNKKMVGVFVIYLMLIVFVIGGYQHVVANLYIFSIAGFLSTQSSDPLLQFTSNQAGAVFLTNLIPSMFGNLIGGIAISGIYLWAQSYIASNKLARLEKAPEIIIINEIAEESEDPKSSSATKK